MDDAEAVRLLKQGDRRGAETLVARYQMSTYNLTLRMLGNPADAEDATQEVFLKAFQRIHQYRTGEAFGGWLHGIAQHHAIDALRRRPRPVALEPAPAVDTERLAISRLERESVQRAMSRLAPRERTLLVLRYWEDKPIDNIARTMGLSAGAVKVALLRARRALAEHLQLAGVTAHDL